MSTTTKSKVLLSFHGDPAIKEKYMERLKAHRFADEIIQGVGYETGKQGTKGCAIGCTLNKYDHKAFETELGIPMILARLEDRIFEGLSVEESKDFPINFLSAIPVGKDLSNIYKKFFIWLLVDAVDGVIKFAKKEATKLAITNVANLLTKSLLEKVTSAEFRAVQDAAWAARNAADAAAAYADAADAAAYAAYAAYAAAADAAAADAAAAYAAYAAAADAYAAAYDAYAYAYAAAAAAAAAADAYAAAAAAADAAAAKKKFYSKMAAKIIELLAAA